MNLPTFDELGSIQALKENYVVEAKRAQGRSGDGAVPNSMWETYSAFANAKGGWLLLGVEETSDGLKPVGLGNPEKLRKQIWDILENPQKVSVNLLDEQDIRLVEESGVVCLVMRVPPATRENRPVYIGENPMKGTYIRRHEGDYRVEKDRVKRMLAEARNPGRDALILSGYSIDDLREESLKAFRNVFRSVSPDHPFLEGDDEELLRQVGGIKMNRTTGEKGISAAGLLMFGKLFAIRDHFDDFFLDFQQRDSPADDGPRWSDRVCTDGSGPQNVYDFFRTVTRRLTAEVKIPFQLQDGHRRIDETDVHSALREALVNTLIHADYDNSKAIRIIKFPSMFVFRNPGRLRVTKAQAFQGGISDCRNPNLQKMFQMIGAAEKAGSGVPKIVRAWKDQHWRQPNLVEDIDHELTELTLTTASLLDDEAVEALRHRFAPRFDSLDRDAKVILVTTFEEHSTTHERLMEVLDDIHSRDLTLKLDQLVNKGFLNRLGSGRGSYYELTGENGASADVAPPTLFDLHNSSHDSDPHSHDSDPSIHDSDPSIHDSDPSIHDSDEKPPFETATNPGEWSQLQQIAQPIAEMGRVPRERMEKILLQLCRDGFRTRKDLARLVNRTEGYLQQNYLTPLVDAGRLQPRHPERKTHPCQAYRTSNDTDAE